MGEAQVQMVLFDHGREESLMMGCHICLIQETMKVIMIILQGIQREQAQGMFVVKFIKLQLILLLVISHLTEVALQSINGKFLV